MKIAKTTIRVKRGSLKSHDLNLAGLIWGIVGAIDAEITLLLESHRLRVLTD